MFSVDDASEASSLASSLIGDGIKSSTLFLAYIGPEARRATVLYELGVSQALNRRAVVIVNAFREATEDTTLKSILRNIITIDASSDFDAAIDFAIAQVIGILARKEFPKEVRRHGSGSLRPTIREPGAAPPRRKTERQAASSTIVKWNEYFSGLGTYLDPTRGPLAERNFQDFFVRVFRQEGATVVRNDSNGIDLLVSSPRFDRRLGNPIAFAFTADDVSRGAQNRVLSELRATTEQSNIGTAFLVVRDPQDWLRNYPRFQGIAFVGYTELFQHYGERTLADILLDVWSRQREVERDAF